MFREGEILRRLDHVIWRLNRMAVDVTKLQAAVARLVDDVEKVLPFVSDPAAQAALQASVDALSTTLDTEAAKVEGVTPVAPAA